MAANAGNPQSQMTPERWRQVKELLAPALEMDARQRSAYLDQVCDQDSSLRRELDSLVAAAENAAPDILDHGVFPGTELLPPDSWVGHRVGSYKIVEKIGAGGMGEVYRAFRADDEYRQQVAVKLVRSGDRSGLIVSRFKNERQILATLDHPNIARLLDGGTTDNGLPYFIMELIEGQPIDKFCEEKGLSVQQRLELFLQVCSAVQYAHRHLIIHRDIKPGNILVTADGVPKLLDFGIAKILDSSAVDNVTPTVTVFQVLTPTYASPEQIKGQNITTATDVYSLGVVLYELLTGYSPYQLPAATPDELSRAVREAEPKRPSDRCMDRVTANQGGSTSTAPENTDKLRKSLQGDLDNIVLMALRKEPERRYSSIEQFAEDIRRHLGNLPVIARRDTLGYRSAKFVKRHRAGVAASAIVTLALLGGMAITIREARIAQRRFNDVRSLANSLMFDVHDSIRDLPGSTAARKIIIEKALKYLDSLAQESRNDAALQRELAAGYKRIGDVQGYQFSANMGETASALGSYRKALAIRQAIFAAHSNNVDDALAVAESLQDMAETLLASGDTSAAVKNIQQAVAISEPLERAHPNDLKVLSQLRDSYQTEADILAGNFNLSNLGETAMALAYREKELKIAERISAMQPKDLNIQRTTAVTITRMGDQLLLNGEWRKASEYYRRARDSFEQLASQSPSARVLDNLHGIYTRLQQVEMWSGKANEAVGTNRKALLLSARMSHDDPSNSYEKLVLAGDYGNLADSLSRAGVKREAASFSQQAIDLMAELVAHNPTNVEYLGMQAAEYVTAGDVSRRFGDYHQAVRHYREALAISLKIQATDSSNADARLRIAAIDDELGLALLQARDLDSAAETYHQALQIVEPQTAAPNPSEEALYATANAYSGMGEVQAALASDARQSATQRTDLENARVWYERSLKVWGRVKEPGAVSPEGYEPVLRSIVSARLTECQRKLATLH